jgi:primosomal protein N' (replication factor Y)
VAAEDSDSPAAVIAALVQATNAHDIDAFVALFATDYDSQQPAHPDRAFRGRDQVGANWTDVFTGVPDFRADERTFQLLTQVAGRAGRGQTPGKVILQTYFQDHYAVQYAAQHDFIGFYEKELQFRSWMHYPPYSALANVLVRGDQLDEVLEWSGLLGKWFNQTRHETVRVLGPAAAPIMRLKRDYRYHFILRSPSREKLNTTLRAMLAYAARQKVPRTQVIVDMVALWLM